MNKMILEFRMWLQGTQGGGNKKVTADHNGDMVIRLCRALDVQKLIDLLDDNKLWRLFLNKKSKKSELITGAGSVKEKNVWAGQTSRSYLVVIKKFMGFIEKDSRRQKFTTSGEREIAREITIDLKNWSKSFKTQIGIE